MLGKNWTPFAAIAFQQAHRDGADMAVIAVRASLELGDSGNWVLAANQKVVLSDAYDGDPQSAPLVKVSDLVPFKPATDITILANSHRPPNLKGEESWIAGVRIDDYRYLIKAFGERNWIQKSKLIRPGAPKPADLIPVDYRLAWSDLLPGETPGDPAPINPIGVRCPARPVEIGTKLVHLAQINSPEEDYSDPFALRHPQGFGPIAPFWKYRQQYCGTYDSYWVRDRHPLLPPDFDYRFYQCAHPRLICEGYLNGTEEFELYRLSSKAESVCFRLPGISLGAEFLWLDDRKVTMQLNLDGVHIDTRGNDVFLDITWRGWLPICPQFFGVDLFELPAGQTDESALPRPGLFGIEGYDAFGERIA